MKNNLEKLLSAKFPDHKGNYPEFQVCCPYCRENRYRFGINLKKRVGHCFNCQKSIGARGILTLLGIAHAEIGVIQTDFSFLEEPEGKEVTETLVAPDIDVGRPLHEVLNASDSQALLMHMHAKRICKYLESRGFNPIEFSEDYGALVPYPGTRYTGRVILPVYEKGNLVYFQARATNPQAKPKYLNPAKEHAALSKSQIVYNLDKAKEYEEIILCEGIFSAVSAGKNAVGIFGKELSDTQMYKIFKSGVRSVVVMLDEGAEEQAQAAALKLSTRLKVRVAKLLGGDPNELPHSDVVKAVQKAVVFDEFVFV